MRFVLYLLLSLSLFGCRESAKEPINNDPTENSGNAQMRDSIQKIIASVNFRNHPYETGEKLKLIENEVQMAQRNNTLTPAQYVEYGKALLEDGKSIEAILAFEDLLDKLPENKKVTPQTKVLHEALAISYLRLGEQQNCIENHTEESCLFPIKGGGIHKSLEGSSKAIKKYEEILAAFPDDIQSLWLYNLAHMTLGKYPHETPKKYRIDPKVFQSDIDFPEFKNISMFTGLDDNHLAGGVIIDDFNNDHLLDVFVSSWGMFGHLKLFINKGDGTFDETTEKAGLQNMVGGLQVVPTDFNNDGNLDIYVVRGAWRASANLGQLPNSLLKNNGDGSFQDVTIAAGLYGSHPTQSVSWFDANLDGWLDLFVGNETHSPNELHPSELFLNQKDGTFKNVAAITGIEITRYIKGTNSGDFDNDGRPDLYVSVMDGANLLFHNEPSEAFPGFRFVNVANHASVEEPAESFPTWFFDYDNDGWEDLFVSCYDRYLFKQPAQEVAADYLNLKGNSDFPRLYKNNGDGTFTNRTSEAKLDRLIPTMGCNFGDINSDGYLDFYLGTGAPDFRSVVPNLMFVNSEGSRFLDVTTSGNFGHVQKGHGVSIADLDNDGDQDVYMVMGGALSGDSFQNALFENPGNRNRSIQLKLIGSFSNKAAIGAKVRVQLQNSKEETRWIYRTVGPGSSFGGNPLRVFIAAPEEWSIQDLSIKWPNGKNEFISYGGLPWDEKHLFVYKEDHTEPELQELKTFTWKDHTMPHH